MLRCGGPVAPCRPHRDPAEREQELRSSRTGCLIPGFAGPPLGWERCSSGSGEDTRRGLSPALCQSAAKCHELSASKRHIPGPQIAPGPFTPIPHACLGRQPFTLTPPTAPCLFCQARSPSPERTTGANCLHWDSHATTKPVCWSVSRAIAIPVPRHATAARLNPCHCALEGKHSPCPKAMAL